MSEILKRWKTIMNGIESEKQYEPKLYAILCTDGIGARIEAIFKCKDAAEDLLKTMQGNPLNTNYRYSMQVLDVQRY
jgi:hypothetical protein